jgi:hypothetical protein
MGSEMKITVKLTPTQAGEIFHKVSIIDEEPDLQESYELTPADVAALMDTFRRDDLGAYTFDSKYVDVLCGELDNTLDIAAANLPGLDGTEAASLRGHISSMKGAQRKLRAAK